MNTFLFFTISLLFLVSFQSLNPQSTGENLAVVGRAISTPERKYNPQEPFLNGAGCSFSERGSDAWLP